MNGDSADRGPRLRRVQGLACVVLLAAGCGMQDVLNDAFGPGSATIRETIGTFPAGHRETFILMEQRCTRCHTLGPPLSTHIPAGAWRDEVRRMMRKPGSALPEADAERIAAFLEYFAERRRSAAPR